MMISGQKDSQHYVSKVVAHFSGEFDIAALKKRTNQYDDITCQSKTYVCENEQNWDTLIPIMQSC